MSEHHYVQVNPVLGDRQATGGENGHFLHCCSQQCMLTPTAVLSDHTYLWQSPHVYRSENDTTAATVLTEEEKSLNISALQQQSSF